MNDSELISLAEKASGFKYFEDQNPLAKDDLALRLAVNLHLVVASMRATHEKSAFTTVYHFNGVEYATEPHGSDPYAATRRAIVRAAASIGAAIGGEA